MPHRLVLVLARLAPPEIARALDSEYACLNAFEAPGVAE